MSDQAETGKQVKEPKRQSPSVSRNARIFSVSMFLLQIAICLIYGFLINVAIMPTNIAAVLTASGLAILVIAGFGLVFGYLKRLTWSGLGFNFLITALCIQIYPLINAFWTKVQIQYTNPTLLNFSYSGRIYNLYLDNWDISDQSATQVSSYGNSINNTFKCALAICVAFSSILGRAGHLQCFLTTLIGIVGFELNRQIIQGGQGQDTFGTFYIFTFGGFMGLSLGMFMWLRERKEQYKITQFAKKRFNGSEHSVFYAFFGTLIIFCFFPLLAFDIDFSTYFSNYSPYVNPLCVILALGAGALGAILVSAFVNGAFIARDAIHGPIAGVIAVGASSLYITNPVYAVLAGCTGGIVQSLIQNIFEKNAVKNGKIISTISWSLFGAQGIVGACFAAGWKAILYTKTNGFSVTPQVLSSYTSQFQFYSGLISAGIGASFGILIGLLLYLINGQTSVDHFDDVTYWHNDDGLRHHKERGNKKYPSQKDNLVAPASDQTSSVEVISIESAEQDLVNEYAYL